MVKVRGQRGTRVLAKMRGGRPGRPTRISSTIPKRLRMKKSLRKSKRISKSKIMRRRRIKRNRKYRKLYGRGRYKGLLNMKKYSKRGVIARSSLKNPNSLSKLDVRTKVTNGYMSHNAFEYFVNTKYVFAGELERTPAQIKHCPNSTFIDTLTKDNPTKGLFFNSDILLGMDDSVLNPPLITKSTKIKLDSLNGANYVFSLFPPMNTSYKAINQLSILLGVTRGQLEEIVIQLKKTFTVYIYSDQMNTEGRLKIAATTIDVLESDAGERFNQLDFGIDIAAVRALIKTNLLNIFVAFIESLALKNTTRTLAAATFVIVVQKNVMTENGLPVVTSQVVKNDSVYAYTSAQNNKEQYTDAVYVLAKRWAVSILNLAPTAPTTSYINLDIDRDAFDATHPFNGCLSVLGSCLPNMQKTFIEFIADIWYYALAVAGPDKANDAIGGLYFSELTESGYANAVSFVNLDKLQKEGYVRVKLITKKELVYKPKTEPNAHLLYISRGTTFTMEANYKRNYTSFMSLFRNTVRNKVLRSNLTPLGERFYKKLEPAYNFGFIGLDDQFQ